MDETAWLTCTDPVAMIEALVAAGAVSDRKARLFTCACARVGWSLLDDDALRNAVVIAEQHANGESDFANLSQARYRAVLVAGNPRFAGSLERSILAQTAVDATSDRVEVAAARTAARARHAVQAPPDVQLRTPAVQAGFLRCIFSPPSFQPIAFSPAWRSKKALTVALAAYDNRQLPSGHLDSDQLGVLSDALEEDGCDDRALLGHLRKSGLHVRGCWALDQVLPRE